MHEVGQTAARHRTDSSAVQEGRQQSTEQTAINRPVYCKINKEDYKNKVQKLQINSVQQNAVGGRYRSLVAQ